MLDAMTHKRTNGKRDRRRNASTTSAQSRFLAAFGGLGNINNASRAAKIGRTTHYWWLKTDPTYQARFEAARQRAVDTLADEAVRRARDGVKRLVTYQGKAVRHEGQVVWETLYSDAILMFLLKAWDRKTFGDAVKIDLSSIKTINDVPPELLKLVLEKLQEDYDRQQAARQIEAGETPAAEQTIDVKPSG